MASHTCDQDYFGPVPKWALYSSAYSGWKAFQSGGGMTEYWVNKIWDPGGPAWVYWETMSLPDTTGASYPDPYMTGFGGCSGYRVASRRYR